MGQACVVQEDPGSRSREAAAAQDIDTLLNGKLATGRCYVIDFTVGQSFDEQQT